MFRVISHTTYIHAILDLPESRSVVLNFFYISYLFSNKITRFIPNTLKWCSFIENMKLTNAYSLE